MKKAVLLLSTAIIIALIIYTLYLLNIIPHKKYTNKDFNIKDYISKTDKDNDGIDDQTDMLNSVKEYIKTKPIYESKYYSAGYPDDNYGVCTDVVAFGLLNSGYDIRELLNEDVKEYPEDYEIEERDKNIDFRRVLNLNNYFKKYFISLTTDIYDIDSWQGGDIIVFEKHIGVISDKRNKKGIPFLIHHTNVQSDYEEDILELRNDIIAHYRIS